MADSPGELSLAIDPSTQQRLAADPQVSAWVNASAGSGKTKVLTDRVLALLLGGSRPHGILCLTFTKAAAGEMANRVADRLALWARADQADLTRHLTDLLGDAPDSDTIDRARRLFARVQEAPGGVRIDTVHAFCQGVLQRFPVEAKVPPHFDVLEDRDQRLLLSQARDELVRQVTADQNSPLAGAWGRMLARLSESRFAKLAQEIASKRSQLQDLTIEQVASRLAIPLEATPENVLRAACADEAFDAEALWGAISQLSLAKGKTAPKLVAGLEAWLAASPQARDLNAYRSLLLTNEMTPRKFGKLLEDEIVARALEAESSRLIAVFEEATKVQALADTGALLTVAQWFLTRYEALKKIRSLLDYDDLILGMRQLLIDPGAAWVHYKLDRGIDHVLVDEAQDTNPEQWQVIAALVSEFFAGEGIERSQRTLFAVGDPKQSIYSFQGADPQGFIDRRSQFATQAEASGQVWRDVPLTVSFRSAAPVLQLVDEVFSDPLSLGVGATPVIHTAHRKDAPGWIEVWPLLPPADTDVIDDVWELPRIYEGAQDAEDRLAYAVAAKIKALIDSGEPLHATENRPIRAGDIMVLVRRRRSFGRTLVQHLKRLGVPVAGVDRMALTRQLAVQDLSAFGQFLLLPSDDLTLAAMLKGPFFQWDEDRLFRLAHGRKGSLWSALQAAEDPADKADARRLADWLNRAKSLAPFALYSRLLIQDGGRAAIRGFLGPEADDPVDEFLTLALDFPRHGPPTLQHFLRWLAADDVEIKRELDTGERDEVRLLTVHAAKGLQAPIVFLPDTMRAPEGGANQRPQLVWDGPVGIWAEGSKSRRDPVSDALMAAETAKVTEEEARLLYVALTRAEDRLYVCGWETQQKGGGTTWYQLVAEACTRLTAAGEMTQRDFTVGDHAGEGFTMGEAPTALAVTEPPASAPPLTLPSWALRPAPSEPSPGRPLAPSRPSPIAPALRSPLRDRDAADNRFRRGTLLHRLLQYLPGIAPAQRQAIAAQVLSDSGLTADQIAEYVAAVAPVLDDSRFAAVFAADALVEASLTGLIDGVVVCGTVDRLLVTPAKVFIIDYKTNRNPPGDSSAIPLAYAKQMQAYSALLHGIYPDRTIEAALLWTEVPRLDIVTLAN